ncbi:MAG: MerR family transcriptional regulator, partial [Oscillibacter sp.]|nr:MerR family transcriptional regulator [Oscillibacter sp.]
MEYTVKALADLAGVTPRTLRWYDRLGLLKPLRTTEAGYRLYGPPQLDRLQDILFYRELGLDLASIRTILDDPAFDRQAALQSHLAELKARRVRLDALILTVQRTIDDAKGGTKMTDHEKFEAFKRNAVAANEAAYGAEIRQKYGDAEVDRANACVLALTQEEYAQWKSLGDALLQALSAAVKAGADPAGPEGQRIAALHRRWLSYSWEAYTPQAHAGLAELYVADPRFTAYYDREVPGCAAFLRDAVRVYTKALEQGLQRRDQQHRRQQQRADGEGAQQELVVPESPGEDHRTAGLAVEAVEQAAQAQRGKGHGAGHRRAAAGQADVEGDDGGQGDHQALRAHAQQEGFGQDALAAGTGLFLHHRVAVGLQPQGDGGQGVRQQVDEQQMHRREGHRQPRQRGIQHRQNARRVAGEQELDGLLDVGVDVPAVLDGLDDGGEVVVRQHHAGGVLGHLGAGDAHGHADVRLLQGRGVVDAVAGHGHQIPPLLPGPDDADLVLRGHPGVYADPGHELPQLLIAHGLDGGALHSLGTGSEDADLPGDGGCGDLVVAGDHNGPDAGGDALADCCLG